MEFIIDDSSPIPPTPAGFSTGAKPRDFSIDPLGGFAAPFDLPLIPRSEWQARIEEGNQQKSFLSHMRRAAGLKSQDQNGTNFCWMHAVVSANRLLRAVANQPNVALSAAAGASIINDYQNEGGWSTQALKWVVSNGMPSTEFWPENKIDRQYDTPAMRANAKLHQITEWWDLQPQNLDQLMTCLFLRIPVPVGFNWWGHAICAMDPVFKNGQYGIKIWNSWADSWGDLGEADLLGSKAIADDQVAPRVTDAS